MFKKGGTAVNTRPFMGGFFVYRNFKEVIAMDDNDDDDDNNRSVNNFYAWLSGCISKTEVYHENDFRKNQNRSDSG